MSREKIQGEKERYKNCVKLRHYSPQVVFAAGCEQRPDLGRLFQLGGGRGVKADMASAPPAFPADGRNDHVAVVDQGGLGDAPRVGHRGRRVPDGRGVRLGALQQLGGQAEVLGDGPLARVDAGDDLLQPVERKWMVFDMIFEELQKNVKKQYSFTIYHYCRHNLAISFLKYVLACPMPIDAI